MCRLLEFNKFQAIIALFAMAVPNVAIKYER